MSSSETTIEVLPNSDISIIDLTVERSLGGIQITAKSKFFEDFFKAAGSITSGIWSEGDKSYKYYSLPGSVGSGQKMLSLYYTGGDRDIFINEYGGKIANLAFLRLIGLSDGIKVTYSTVATDDDIDRYMAAAKSMIEILTKDIIKKTSRKLVITCRLT